MGLNWRRELLVLATLAMETCWVYAWLRFLLTFGMGPQPYLSFFTIFGILLVSTYSGRALMGPTDTLRNRQIVLAVLIVTSVLLAVRANLYPGTGLWNLAWIGRFTRAVGSGSFRDVLVLVALVGLWWRGLSHARGIFSVVSTGFRFRFGVIALVWLFLAGIVLQISYFYPILFLFFSVALLAMALARLEEVSRVREGQATPFNRFWLGAVVAATLGSIFIAAVASSIFSLPTIHRILGWLAPLFYVVDLLIYYTLVIIAHLLEPLMVFFVEIGRQAFQNFQFNLPATPEATSPQSEGLNAEAPLRFLLSYLSLLRWVVLGGLGLMVLILLVRTLHKQRLSRSEIVPEIRESVWSAEAFRQDLTAWLTQARQHLGDRLKLLGRLRQAYATATIRQIYGSLLRWAAEQGYPRPLPSTPYEYLPLLIQTLPETEAEVREITEAYVRVHYGEAPTSAEDLVRVRAAWERLRGTLTPV